MSFDFLYCNKCTLCYWTIPQIYGTTESGEVVVHMYPTGTTSFDKRYGYSPSKKVRLQGAGQVNEFYCKDCQKTSNITDADEKQCRACGSLSVIDLSSLEGKPCPRCGVEQMTRVESALSL